MKTKLIGGTLCALSSLFIMSCSNDNFFPEESTQDTVTKSIVEDSIENYLSLENWQWKLSLTEEEAAKMGKLEEYKKTKATLEKINSDIQECMKDPNCTLGFNLSNGERIVTRGGEVISKSINTPLNDEPSTLSLLKRIQVGESAKFSTDWKKDKIKSHVYVQSFHLWNFLIQDKSFGQSWGETGIASKNCEHEWIAGLVHENHSILWKFDTTGSATDGTKIEISFYD